jgi:Na+/melibiose symporter-like transporter
MLPEILPLRIRGTAMGVAIFLHWIANFIVSQTFPSLLAAVGPGPVFLGYAMIGVLAFIFVRALVTETKGRSLEQIEADLQQKARFASG